MTYRWHDLSRFNAERARGVVHTVEWRELMAVQQAEFDREQDYEHPYRVFDALGHELGRFATVEEQAAFLARTTRRRWWQRRRRP